jgi:dihydroorotate dehydrogenase (NAD+) catalytic subunit
VVVSIWGRTVEEYHAAAELVANHCAGVAAVEVNLSCPNTEAGRHLFAHHPAMAAEVIAATDGVGVPRWAKLSANTDRLVEVAESVSTAGAEAVTLINTLLGMVIDTEGRTPALGAGGGGLSGAAIHPVAVRSVYEVHAALPELPIVGVGGVDRAESAVEMLMAGASAVQVGTATFRDPSAAEKVRLGLEQWCRGHNVGAVSDLKGAAHA